MVVGKRKNIALKMVMGNGSSKEVNTNVSRDESSSLDEVELTLQAKKFTIFLKILLESERHLQ